MSRPLILRAAAVALLAAGGLYSMNSFGRLQWPSVLAWSGIAIVLSGIVSILIPLSWLGFSSHLHGLLIGILFGGALLAAAWWCPGSSFTTLSPSTRLDAFMPTCQFHERHELTMHASPGRVREALNRVSFADIGVIQTLGRIRAIAMGRLRAPAGAQGASPNLPVLEMIRHPLSGFFPLDDTPREFVFGLAGQPWKNIRVTLASGEFLAWAAPGNVKIAANFLIEDAGDGRTRVVTETRIAAGDEAARRKMGRYWALIYPGSGLIRRSLLNAIRERAERP